MSYFKKFHRYIRIVTIASGILLVFLGILIYTNSLSLITFYLYKFGIGWDFNQ
ncbi:MAG: hypothetical protein HZA06_04155 [Nitrospirae bacterium]|nr:hypothetical protein [Nitrospirota bacterium]